MYHVLTLQGWYSPHQSLGQLNVDLWPFKLGHGQMTAGEHNNSEVVCVMYLYREHSSPHQNFGQVLCWPSQTFNLAHLVNMTILKELYALYWDVLHHVRQYKKY